MGLGSPPFACIDCGSRSGSQGRCGACGEGPLLDLRQPGVVGALLQEDATRQSKRQALLIWVSVPVAAVSTLLLGLGPCAPILGAGVGYGLSLVLIRVFPPKRLFADLG